MRLVERLFHEEYETADGDLVLFRCSECGYTTLSIGHLHAHVEQHWDFPKWWLHRLPRYGGWGDWMDYTEVLAVRESEQVDLAEVENL